VQSQITKNILNTIIYCDILNFPLTSFEVWKYLTVIDEHSMSNWTWTSNVQISLGEIIEALESKELKKHIEEFRGFYFLRGRKTLVEQRIQNDKNSIAKYKIAERVAWWLRFVPFVRMVAVTGTLAMKNPEKNSDIDFLVVLEKGRIWTGRLLVTLAVHLLGKRRHGDKIKNRICLNYFITTGSLEIKRQDLFAANEYSFIYPIFDSLVIPSGAERSREIYVNKALASHAISTQISPRVPINRDLVEMTKNECGMTKKSVFCQFGEANIEWMKKFKPNFKFSELKPSKYYMEHSRFSRFIQKPREVLLNFIFGDRIESWLKRKQIARIKRNPLTYKKGGYVEYDDENLVFLPEPQGPGILEKFKASTSKKDFL